MGRDITAHLKVRHFALIVAIADFGTTHRAADSINMTQSTASKMLRDLEEMIGAPLFKREPRGMTPTPLGEFMLANARTMLTRMRRFADEFEVLRQGGYGTLVLGAIMGSAPDLVAKAVAEMKRSRPQLVIQMLGETSDTILDMLEEEKLDLAVGRFSSARHRQLFAFELLAEEPLVLVGRKGHALSEYFEGDLPTLSTQPWVLQPKATPTRQVLDGAFEKADIKPPRNVIECGSIFAILNLVQVSDAIALLPTSVVDAHLKAGLLDQLPMRPTISVPGFGLVTRKGDIPSEPARMFADILRRHAAELP